VRIHNRDTLRSRTDTKLNYAQIHVEELREQPPAAGRGHAFERAHQEACLAQLFGAYAALLQELNADLNCGLAPEDVTLGNMREELKKRGRSSLALKHLYCLDQDQTSWFHKAKVARDHTTHIGGIPLSHYVGGQDNGVTALRNPKTTAVLQGDATDTLAGWVLEMERLVQRIRYAAVEP
jgi:hypothetical protein